jgi:hypothetical protein
MNEKDTREWNVLLREHVKEELEPKADEIISMYEEHEEKLKEEGPEATSLFLSKYSINSIQPVVDFLDELEEKVDKGEIKDPDDLKRVKQIREEWNRYLDVVFTANRLVYENLKRMGMEEAFEEEASSWTMFDLLGQLRMQKVSHQLLTSMQFQPRHLLSLQKEKVGQEKKCLAFVKAKRRASQKEEEEELKEVEGKRAKKKVKKQKNMFDDIRDVAREVYQEWIQKGIEKDLKRLVDHLSSFPKNEKDRLEDVWERLGGDQQVLKEIPNWRDLVPHPDDKAFLNSLDNLEKPNGLHRQTRHILQLITGRDEMKSQADFISQVGQCTFLLQRGKDFPALLPLVGELSKLVQGELPKQKKTEEEFLAKIEERSKEYKSLASGLMKHYPNERGVRIMKEIISKDLQILSEGKEMHQKIVKCFSTLQAVLLQALSSMESAMGKQVLQRWKHPAFLEEKAFRATLQVKEQLQPYIVKLCSAVRQLQQENKELPWLVVENIEIVSSAQFETSFQAWITFLEACHFLIFFKMGPQAPF